MQFLRTQLAQFPFLENKLKSFYWFIQGLPQVSNSKITKEIIQECIDKPNPTILEIGCNDGKHTLWLLEIFEKPKIYCFEPEPRAIAKFKEKVGQRSNVNLFEMAISDKNGNVTFYQSGGHVNKEAAQANPEGWDESGSIRQPKNHTVVMPWITFKETITVNSSTLDTWCKEHGIDVIDFIWMDVQGAEMDVFRGGQKTLKNTRFIYTEYSNRELYKGQYTLKKLLSQLRDFEVLIRYPGDVLLRNNKFTFSPNKTKK